MTTAESARVVATAEELSRFVRGVASALGAPEHVAAAVARSLVGANLAGHDSHGVLLLPYWTELVERGQIRPAADAEVMVDRGSLLALDGHFGFGPVTAEAAVALAVERGREHGIACILARNANHIGRLGEYTAAVADAGLAAILLVNCQGSGQMLAPFGGSERRLTNNPISIATPGRSHPVLLDMALSVAAEAKVWLAKARGERLPPGWILDAAGEPSTDPDALFAGGTLLPVGGEDGGHKGYGLIVLVDILVGILSGGGVCRADSPDDFSNALLLVTIDPAPMVSRETYASQLSTLREYVTSSERRPGVNEILFPGDPEAANSRDRAAGGIPVEPSTWSVLVELGDRLGVAAPAAAP